MLRRYTILCFLAAGLLSCNGNPLGDTPQSIEGFTIYTTDFQNQTDGGMKAALLEVIAGSKETLNCAFSALTISDVTQALIVRSRAGVKVKIAFDTDNKNGDAGSLALQASGAFAVVTTPGETAQGQLLYGNLGAGVMRHNYCMADERYIWISTAAVDDTQMAKTPAIAFKIGSPQFGLARDFLRESSMFSQLLFGYGKARTDFNTKFTALDQVIGAFWGPQEKPLDVLATNLSEATQSVEFYSTGFETTNSKKADLDVPQTLSRLETAYGVTIKKYFASQALFGVGSKAYTLSNPHQYVNNSVRASANIFVVDKGLASAKVFVYTGSLRSQANSADDSVLIELRGRRVADTVGAYLDRIGAVSTSVSNVGDASANLEVVISEILWMGSYNNALTSDSDDEFIELFNTTASAINLSGWKFACTTNGTTANASITFPPGALIAPNGYFVVANKNIGAIGLTANHFDPKLKVTNGSYECRLGNGKNAATVYGVANFGDEIDRVGDASNGFSSPSWNRGLDDSTNRIRRSMERINTALVGTSNTNWRTNVYNTTQNTFISTNYNQQTFASPGASGTFTETVVAGDIIINEILWMGSYDNTGTGQSNDEFIELKNTTASVIDIGNWTISGAGVSTITIPSGQTIAANSYYVIARDNTNAIPSANYYKGTSLGITNTAFQLELRTGLSTLIDTANNGGVPFAGATDSTNKAAQSMERITPIADGTLAGSWQSARYSGAGVAAAFKIMTIATPGEANSNLSANYNGGFETWAGTNTPTGWQIVPNSGIAIAGFTQDSVTPNEGVLSMNLSGTTTSNTDALYTIAPVSRNTCTHLAIWLRGTGSAKAVVVQVTGTSTRYFNLTNANTYTSLASAAAIAAGGSVNYGTGFDTLGAWKVAYLDISSATAFDYIKFRLGTSSAYNLSIDGIQYLDASKNPCTP